VAFEAAFGWSWLADLLEDYGFDAHLVHPLRCKAIASARLKNDKGRRRDPGAAAARGPAARGVDRPGERPAAPRAAAAPDQPGPPRHPAAQPDPRGRRRPRLRPVRQLLDRARPRLAGRARPAAFLAGDRHRLPGGHRRPGAADRPDRRRAARPRQGRPAGQGTPDAARRRGVHRPGHARRDR
jgi:hypothetical protein